MGARHGAWDLVYLWFGAVAAANAFFVSWFGLMALLRLDSQRGVVPDDAERREDDSDDEGLRTGL